jgi:hypothetical protein
MYSKASPLEEQKERPDSSGVGVEVPPRKGDKLFRSDDDWEMNACVNYGSGKRLYSHGYLTAARSLAAQVIESRREQDGLIYPIVYLYRHHCEITLKGIIYIASRLLDRSLEKAEKDALYTHGLLPLWTHVCPLLNPVCDEVGNAHFPQEDLDGIESYIQQIHAYDPDGQRFRYAIAKGKGKNWSNRCRSRSPSSISGSSRRRWSDLPIT